MKFDRPVRAADHLWNVLAAIGRIEKYLDGQTEAAFLESDILQDAVIRNLEVIGEAPHQVEEREPEFRAMYGDLPWDEAYGMRNLLAHGYFGVRPGIVWSTVQNNLPGLRARLSQILASGAAADGPGTS
jgi:uncharacterized protein with HEPN domain